MSCPTATRWFIPDSDYYATTGDYALFNAAENIIRREINEGNNCPPPTLPDGSPVPVFFDELLGCRRGEPRCYEFATMGRMLWADVDDSKPEHKAEAQKLLSKTYDSLKENKKEFAALREEVLDLLLDASLPYPDSSGDEEAPPEKQRLMRRETIIDDLQYSFEDGRLNAGLLSALLANVKNPEKKEEVMGCVTAQHPPGDKRPVMVLVGMADSMQTSNSGEMKGWVVGYDFVKDLIICKPFFSDKEHHPLTSSWYTDVADDGVSFSCAPKAFVEEYLELGTDLQSKLDSGEIKEVSPTDCEEEIDLLSYLELPDITFAFRMLVRALTARFILTHWSGFVGSRPDLSKEDATTFFTKVRDTHRSIKKVLGKIQVPVVLKAENKDKKLCICAVEEMEWALEQQEDHFRRCAVTEKEQGHEKAAMNTAKFYEKILNMTKTFNEDPEKDI